MKTDAIGPVLFAADELDPTKLIPTAVSEDDPDLQVSPPDIELITNVPILKGLDIPSSKNKNHCSPLDHMRWVDAVEVLLGRGATMPKEIAQLVGITPAFARELIAAVKERWATTLTPSTVNVRREQLYLEAERVKAHAWIIIQNGAKPEMALRLMQTILAAGARQSSLIGAEKLAVSVEATTVNATHKSAVDFEKEFAEANELTPEQLAGLGELIAKTLSKKG